MVDIKKLKQLRKETQVSYALCQMALEKAHNDLEKAKKILIDQGAEIIEGKKGKETQEGGIFAYIHHDKKLAALVELQCETDFVSKNNKFHQLGKELAMQIASTNPKTVEELLNQEYIKDTGKVIDDLIKEYILKLGENIKIKKFIRWELGG